MIRGMSDRMRAIWGLACLAVVAAVAAAAAGASFGAPPPETAIPAVSKVWFTPKKFKAALTPTPGFGATVHYVLSENAVQTFVVKKMVGHNWVTQKGTFVKRGRQGNDVFPFPGILHGHKLKTGHYEMIVTPALAGIGTGKPVTAHFTVIP
jgi:streptogramin lyase